MSNFIIYYRVYISKIIAVLLLTACSTAIFAYGDYDSTIYTDDAGQAAGGWDVVSFFEDESPKEGNNLWKTEYRQAQWLFSSEENLEFFKSDPGRYAPAYGGYCTWAMNKGNLAPGKPEHWDIINGRLYLNYSRSTRRRFLADIDSMIENADEYWLKIEEKLNNQ